MTDLDAVLADPVIAPAKPRRQLERFAVQLLLLAVPALRGQDQRRSRLVHQDAVGFVHDRELQAPQQQALVDRGSRKRIDLRGDRSEP